MWLELRSHLNGAARRKAINQVLSVIGATDASSYGLGRRNERPIKNSFQGGRGFSREMVSKHINVKEAYALLESLQLCCKT